MRRVQNDYHFALVFFSVGISFTKAYIQLVKRGKRYHYEDGKRHHGVLKAPYEDMINATVGVSFGIISCR